MERLAFFNTYLYSLTSTGKFPKEKIFRITTFLSNAATVIAIAIVLTRLSASSVEKMYKNELVILAMSDYPQEFKCIIYMEKGVKSFILLPDSSKVWLNSDTNKKHGNDS